MTATKKFLRATCGLNACRLASTSAYAAPKMTRIECYEVPAGVLLQPVSGHNLANKPGAVTISREQYDDLPRDAYNDTVFACAAMALCGYEA